MLSRRNDMTVQTILAALALAVALAGGVPAWAQDGSVTPPADVAALPAPAPAGNPLVGGLPPVAPEDMSPPAPTSAGYVALLYYRMTGQTPDYEAWAMASDAYAKANSFDKDLVRREKAAEAARAYHLVTFDDPIIVEHEAALSSYSRAKRGFFVENFRPDTFYSFDFIGRHYAVVPLDLMDFQWLSVDSEKTQQKIEDQVKMSGGRVRMYMYLTPTFADKQTPLKLDNKEYWLLSGRVQKLQIYDPRGKRLLWEGYGKSHVEQHQQEVLDLYK